MATPYVPKYRNDAVKTDYVGIPIGSKIVPGYQTTFKDGTSKWITLSDANLSSNFDYSTLTGTKGADGKWTWSGTTQNSIPNLAASLNIPETQIRESLYQKTQIQSVLNGNRVNQLGGIPEAKKVDENLPGTVGTSTENPYPDSQTGQSLEEIQKNASQFDAPQISDGGVRSNYGNYQYPIDANFNEQDSITFKMYRYTPKKFGIKNTLGTLSGDIKGSQMGTVTLPIQPSISDSNGVRWGEESLNAIEALAGAAAYGGITGGASGFEDNLNSLREGLLNGSSDVAAGLAAKFASAAAGSNQSFLTRTTGAILNNNLELLFQGPQLRTFNFTFSMSAREQKESEAIRKIIRFFKQGMTVKRSSTELFLKTPNIFDIVYLHKGQEHTYINKIKTCALQNCSVNYTPAGNYATYEDGAMTQYDISLTFGEIEPLFDDDYDKLGDNHIGY